MYYLMIDDKEKGQLTSQGSRNFQIMYVASTNDIHENTHDNGKRDGNLYMSTGPVDNLNGV